MTVQQYQECFATLKIADVQSDDWIENLVDHKAFSGIVLIKSESLGLDNKSSKCDEQDFSAILDSWYTYIDYERERTRNGKQGAWGPTSTTYSENVFEPSKCINNSGPPKRFRRRGAMWKSITSRLVEHASVGSPSLVI